MGNIQWFGKLLSGRAVIDVDEHYVKQSWRNRCEILSANGREALSVHVTAGGKTSTKDVRIDFSKRWQHQHIQALRSAYGRAPFFEHYWGDFECILSKKELYLWELNHKLLTTALRLLKSDITPTYSNSYVAANENDMRTSISPKARLSRLDAGFSPVPYWQVFCANSGGGQASAEGFEANLSVLDVLMCEGPAATEIIKRSSSG